MQPSLSWEVDFWRKTLQIRKRVLGVRYTPGKSGSSSGETSGETSSWLILTGLICGTRALYLPPKATVLSFWKTGRRKDFKWIQAPSSPSPLISLATCLPLQSRTINNRTRSWHFKQRTGTVFGAGDIGNMSSLIRRGWKRGKPPQSYLRGDSPGKQTSGGSKASCSR